MLLYEHCFARVLLQFGAVRFGNGHQSGAFRAIQPRLQHAFHAARAQHDRQAQAEIMQYCPCASVETVSMACSSRRIASAMRRTASAMA